MNTVESTVESHSKTQEFADSLAISDEKNEAELQEMKQLRREIRILSQYINNLQFLTYPAQLDDMKKDREKKQKRIAEIRKIRHKRSQKKYDNGKGKEKNRARAKKYWQDKKAKENV